MSKTILETKQNKKGVYEMVKESSFWSKVKSAYEKVKTFITDKAKTIKAYAERIKSNDLYYEIKEGFVKYAKKTAIATGVTVAWGVIMPGLWTATIAAAFTISAVKQIKLYKEVSAYKFSTTEFVLDACEGWLFAILGAYALIGVIPAVLNLIVYAWVYSMLFLFV